jgi:hypothetical protein
MVHAAYIDFYQSLTDFNIGDVLFYAGIHTAGDQHLHLITAAVKGNVGVVNHLGNVAAMRADIKFGVLHK